MNNYIYNNKKINNNYMFHNKELSVNDIIWGYEPKGKLIKCEHCGGDGVAVADYDEYWEEYEFEQCSNCKATGYVTQGTGLVIAKYKVVEVHCKDELERITQYNLDASEDLWYLGWRDETFIYKLKKISDVSMELSEFYVASKLDKFNKQYPNFIEQESYIEYSVGINSEQLYSGKNYNPHRDIVCTLTRYNGLTQVIQRSDE